MLKIIVRSIDDNDESSATFTLFDRDAVPLLNITAAQAKDQVEKVYNIFFIYIQIYYFINYCLSYFIVRMVNLADFRMLLRLYLKKIVSLG